MIECRQITHYYERECALDNINLHIAQSEFVAISGESGSGKSTLLSVLSTLLRPSQGEVLLEGRRIDEIKNLDQLRRRKIGFVFQFHYLIDYLTIFENVQLASVERNTHAIENVLKSLDIAEIAGKHPDAISGGQRQRAAIARAIINQPKVLFADEPTGNLDSKNSAVVHRIFRKLCDQGTTLVVATHDPKIARVTDRLIEIEDGRIR